MIESLFIGMLLAFVVIFICFIVRVCIVKLVYPELSFNEAIEEACKEPMNP